MKFFLFFILLTLILIILNNLNDILYTKQHFTSKIVPYEKFPKEKFPKPVIWLYWQNKSISSRMPPYLELCYQTLQKHCGKDFTINLLNDEKFKRISKTYNPKYSNLKSIAKRSDYISYTIGYEFGGIYMDMDIITKNNLLDLFNKLKYYNFIGFEHDGKIGYISVGFFLCRKNNIICKKLKECMDNYLNLFNTNESIDMPWTKCGGGSVSQTIIIEEVNKGYKYLGLDAKKYCYPIHWEKSSEYYWSENKDISHTDNIPYVILLHNNMYSEKIKRLNKENILNGNYRISYIFRKVLYG